MHKNIFKIPAVILLVLVSCNYHTIKLDVVRRSSDLMACTKVFGYSVKKIEEENEILIQTGIYYGPDENEDRQAAIVKINNAEKVLYLTAQMTISGEKTEVYKGDDYSLSLKYIEIKKGNTFFYKGGCRIKKELMMTEYEIEGEPNIHGY